MLPGIMPDPQSWFLILLMLGSGFFFLIKGANWLVDSSSQIAHRVGISPLVVGLTIVAFGTSAPEIVVSTLAALEGRYDLSLGNVIGSNVANIGLVLGASALVLPQVLQATLKLRELFWLFGSLALLWYIASDFGITRLEGGMLVGSCLVYNLHVLFTGKTPEEDDAEAQVEKFQKPAGWTLLGIISIAGGAKLVVMGAVWGAQRLGIPEGVVGLTVVAIGTSLPELAAGLSGAVRGESDISIGNVVGSNVLNILAALGIVAVISPFGVGTAQASTANAIQTEAVQLAFERTLDEDLYLVLAFSLAAVLLPYIGGARGGRLKGLLLLAAYTYFSYWLYESRGLPF